jgi:putative tRNA adenosine deaminase-associated protein
MPYFLAVVAREGEAWSARQLDLDDVGDCEDPDALADVVREVAPGTAPALLLVEREDEWFGLVRVDGDEDARVFVSDAAAAAGSPYGPALGLEPPADDADPAPGRPAGDADLLTDLGTPEARLVALCLEDVPEPAEALLAVARAAGFEEVLDSMR